jgi:hypothetical protein
MPVRESMPRESSIAVAVERYWRFAAWFLMCAHAHTRGQCLRKCYFVWGTLSLLKIPGGGWAAWPHTHATRGVRAKPTM